MVGSYGERTVLYRTMEKKDYPEIGEILNQAFGLFRYVSDERTLKAFRLQYVYSCLSEATYTCVAEQNGKVVGVIMGKAEKDYSLLAHLPYIIKTITYGFKMMRYGKKCKNGIADYRNILEIYQDFSRKHKGEFDGVLTLFAVNEECRGLGVGKELLSRLFDYLQKQNVGRIYLYTDTTCSYEFYEHKGFERLEEKQLTVTREEKPFRMNVFLYGYSI